MNMELTTAIGNLASVKVLDDVATEIIGLMQERAARPTQDAFALGYVSALADAISLIHAKAKEKV